MRKTAAEPTTAEFVLKEHGYDFQAAIKCCEKIANRGGSLAQKYKDAAWSLRCQQVDGKTCGDCKDFIPCDLPSRTQTSPACPNFFRPV